MAWTVGVALLVVALFGLRGVLATDPGAALGALLFDGVLIVAVDGLRLWADRRWPQRGRDD